VLAMSIRELAKRMNAVAMRIRPHGDEAEDWTDLLNRVPMDLRPALAKALADPVRRDRLDAWLLWPFARWARMPGRIRVPEGVGRVDSRSTVRLVPRAFLRVVRVEGDALRRFEQEPRSTAYPRGLPDLSGVRGYHQIRGQLWH
jgi:hypothetical protein